MILIKYGITGNYYVTSESKEELEKVCETIKKSKGSIRWHDKYNTFVIRIKSKHTKALLKKEYPELL